MPDQPVSLKRCASCDRWSGARQPGEVAATVAIAGDQVTGICTGGPWDGQERRARSACGHWRLWGVLADCITTGWNRPAATNRHQLDPDQN